MKKLHTERTKSIVEKRVSYKKWVQRPSILSEYDVECTRPFNIKGSEGNRPISL